MVLSTEFLAGRHQQPDALEAGAAGNRLLATPVSTAIHLLAETLVGASNSPAASAHSFHDENKSLTSTTSS